MSSCWNSQSSLTNLAAVSSSSQQTDRMARSYKLHGGLFSEQEKLTTKLCGMTNQLRSPVLFDTNILFVYLRGFQFRLGKPSQKKKHIFFWALHKLPLPPARILANFSFLRNCQNKKSVKFNLDRGVPCTPIGRLFHFGKGVKIILARKKS